MSYQDVDPEKLADLAREGDKEARTELDQRVLHRFLSQYILEARAVGGMLLHFAVNEGWIELYVKIGERTTVDDVRQGWALVNEWRARIEAFQGPWRAGGTGHLYDTLYHLHGPHWSYSALARRLNDLIADHLVEYLADGKAYEAARPGLKTYGDVFNWQFETRHYGYGWEWAYELLVDMGFTKQAAKQECRAILDELRETGRPWIAEGPVTREQVIFQIKNWRKRTAGGVE